MDLKSKHSYQTQSFLWLLGFSWLLIVCFVGFQYHREKELRTELLDSQLQIINAQLEEALSNARTPHDFFDAHSDFFEGLRITLIDLDGTVVYDSEEPPAEMSNHLDRPEVAAALTDGHGYTIRRQSENNGRTYFYSASRIGDRIVRSSLPYTVSLSQVLNADRNFCGSWVQSPCCCVWSATTCPPVHEKHGSNGGDPRRARPRTCRRTARGAGKNPHQAAIDQQYQP